MPLVASYDATFYEKNIYILLFLFVAIIISCRVQVHLDLDTTNTAQLIATSQPASTLTTSRSDHKTNVTPDCSTTANCIHAAFSKTTKPSNIGLLGGLAGNRVLQKIKHHSLMDLRSKEEERLNKLVKMTTGTRMQKVHRIRW